MEQGYIATRPTVRIRLEERGEQVRRVLCFKGKAGPDGLAREEIETDVTPELFQRLERLIGRPLIRKEQRRYALAGGLTLEVNHVDPGQPEAFFYAEVEFPDLEAARSWQPGPLAAYLDQEVTGTPVRAWLPIGSAPGESAQRKRPLKCANITKNKKYWK